MSATLTRPGISRQPRIDPLRFVGSGPRRKPVVAIASLALVTLCVAIFTSLYLHAGDRMALLAVARDVPQGHQVTLGDLDIVRVSASQGLSPIPADDISRVVGRIAAIPLIRGTLISPTELTTHVGLVKGKAVVGIATKAGQLPAAGVQQGDTVDVILTESPAALEGGASQGITPSGPSATGGEVEVGGVLAANAMVTGVATPSSSPDTVVVSVLIPAALAPLVASASAAGQVALDIVGPNS